MEMKKCKYCGSRLTEQRYSLNKNVLKVLVHIKKLQNAEGFARTRNIYPLKFKGVVTAEITKLKYFGAIRQLPAEQDRISKRSGKWILTKTGEDFLKGIAGLPEYVLVRNKKVYAKGEEILITDKKIKWQKEDEFWKEFLNQNEI